MPQNRRCLAATRQASTSAGTRPRAALATLLACAVAGSAGCGDDLGIESRASARSDQNPENRPPVIESLRFEPEIPLRGERVDVVVTATDPEGDVLEMAYQWKLDGAPVRDRGAPGTGEIAEAQGPQPGVTGIVLRGASRDSRVDVLVIASDGERKSEPARLGMRLGNRPPRVMEVQIAPSPTATVEDRVSAVARGWDADRDELSYTFEWQVNGRTLDIAEPRLPNSYYERGDEIRVAAVASDGMEASAGISSEPIRVVNSAPRITSQAPPFDADGVFRYRVAVEDPDGDRSLRYRLLQSPKGMSINLVDGGIRWQPGKHQAGPHSVRIQVDDRMGGTAEQLLEIHVAFEKAPTPAAMGW